MLKFGTRAGIRGVRCFSSEGQIAAIKRLAGDYSIEVTPMGAKKIANFGEVPGLLPGQDINVTYLVGSDVNDTYDVCRNLVTAGMKPIAHLPARTFAKLKDVESYLDHLKNDIGVHEVLCIGGGADKPVDQIGTIFEKIFKFHFDINCIHLNSRIEIVFLFKQRINLIEVTRCKFWKADCCRSTDLRRSVWRPTRKHTLIFHRMYAFCQ